MTEQHPVTPPPELVREWNEAAIGTHFPPYGYSEYIATQAARWGADQELEAFCEWLRSKDIPEPAAGEVAGLVADLQQQANHGFSDLTRNLLISLASHMAYMQGQLQARHDPDEDDLEDCYWYAESVALRQMVSDVLAGEPAAVIGQPRPMDEDWDALVNRLWSKYETIGCQGERFMYEGDFCTALDLVRQEIAHWGNPAPLPPADGEVPGLVEMLNGVAYWKRHGKPGEPAPTSFDIRQADRLDRAAELLQWSQAK